MYCQNCGTKNSNSASYCFQCGTQLNQNEESSSQLKISNNRTHKTTSVKTSNILKQKQRRIRNIIIWLVVIVVLIFSSLTAYTVYLNYEKQKAPTDSATTIRSNYLKTPNRTCAEQVGAINTAINKFWGAGMLSQSELNNDTTDVIPNCKTNPQQTESEATSNYGNAISASISNCNSFYAQDSTGSSNKTLNNYCQALFQGKYYGTP